MGFFDTLKKYPVYGGAINRVEDNFNMGKDRVTSNLRSFTPAGLMGLYGRDGSGGGSVNFEDPAARRKAAYEYGRELGQKEFYDDPDMIKMRQTREDLAKGYDSAELGALRGESKANVAGQRSSYMNQLQNSLAKGGVGGARAAALTNQANQKFAEQGAEGERRILLDSAKMKREGVNDLQDYLMRQKLGALGLAYGQQALSSADYAAEKGVQAAQSGGKK